MISLLLLAHALAQEPACPAPDALAEGPLSFAWVSPAARRVGAGGWVPVVPASELRTLINETHADLPRMLQALGLRRSSRPPHRAWKVTIFEVAPDRLCRPLPGREGEVVTGLAVCDRGDRGLAGTDDGCGHTRDHHSHESGLDLFRTRWRDAASNGFCVLPAERFLLGR